jgi:hypothetical protein
MAVQASADDAYRRPVASSFAEATQPHIPREVAMELRPLN